MACVVESLVHIIKQYSTFFIGIRPLLQEAIRLRDVYAKYSPLLFENGENEHLEIRIRDVAYQALDLFTDDVDHEDYFFDFDSTQVTREISSIVEEIYLLSEEDGPNLARLPVPSKHCVVGFDEQVNQVVCKFISGQGSLEIVPVVGAAGSGKSTLARQVYDHPVIKEHFEILSWVNASQTLALRSAMCDILTRIDDDTDLMQLVFETHSYLKLKRYLIVFDGEWYHGVWDTLNKLIPDDNNGSRVMLITRNLGTIKNLESRSPHHMTPIDEDASFELLRLYVFERLPFPSELEDIGRKIARNCAGLPLAILLIANVLSRTERTATSWKLVENRQLYFMKEESNLTEEQLLDALASSLLVSAPASATRTIVGFEEAFSQLMNQLTSMSPELHVIPIVGVGGSGKTTLARQLYDHSLIIDSFKARAWITISESFDLRVSLLGIMDCLLIHNSVHIASSDEELGMKVYEVLKHNKYFIVVDDIWNASAWEELRCFFPDEHNGSRVILTTRELSWAEYAKSSSNPHEMQPISKDESWELIVQKVFGGDYRSCPAELEEIGRKIVHNCRGLPLAVATAAGFLSRSNLTVDTWKHVESSKFYSTDDKEIQNDSSLKVIADLFSKDGRRLLDLILNGRQRELLGIAIVGPGGGYGKTTLARLLYDRSLLSDRFSARAWVTCSQHKEVSSLLRDLLGSLEMINNEKPCVIDDNEVAVHVHKALHGRRYLIVLNDIKDKNAWDLLRRYFQDNNNGSRIILTARKWTSDDHDKIKPLNVDPYWEFLIQRAFEQDCVSPKLKESHSKVSELVSTSEKSRVKEFWKLVWQDKSEGDFQSDLLNVTYNHLPYNLKPCFLYMGALPEDYEIKASKLINLWIGEGFVGPHRAPDLEDIAKEYLMDLIARNLLSVCRREQNGEVAAVKIHDVFWKFCSKKAIEENFVWFKDLKGQNISEDEENIRRVSVLSLSQDTDLTGLDSARSFLCFGRVSEGTEPMFFNLRFLRVLDVLQFEFVEFPEEMLELVNLRYLAFTCRADIPSSITKFQYLIFLIIANALSMPSELWHMGLLRHIKCKETWTWHNNDHSFYGEGDLKTLSNVPASLITQKFLNFAYYLTKLGIFINPNEPSTDVDLTYLRKVELLKCTSSDRSLKTSNHLSFLKFPVSLKKLTLKFCNIPCGVMRDIGALPVLEQLILRHSDLGSDQTEPAWEPVEGEFRKLRVLKMEGLNLVRWAANGTHFSELQHLVIRGCHSMQEIPRDFGYARSLQLIEVDASSPGVVESALQIKKEIEEIGNNFLRVVVQETH